MGKYSPIACGYLRVKPQEKSMATVMVVREWPTQYSRGQWVNIHQKHVGT